jgi:hypothetical protein
MPRNLLSRFLERITIVRLAAATALAIACTWPIAANAQPCCAGASVLTPARLTSLEDALLGLQTRGSRITGSFDASASYVGVPAGASEMDFEQDLVGTVRIFGRGQLSVSVPFVETSRSAGSLSEFGGGLGDVALSGRYDPILAGDSPVIPGIAIVAGVVFPTGRAPESASMALGSDSTGTGAYQGTLGVAFEQIWGHVFANLTALATQSAPRHVNGVSERLGLQGTIGAAGGYVFDNGGALALTLSALRSMEAVQDGQRVADSARRRTLLGIAGAFPLAPRWRLQGSLSGDIPVQSLGKNEPANVGLSFLIMRTWQ